MSHLRRELVEEARRAGIIIWTAEADEIDLVGRSAVEAAPVCLREVTLSRVMVVILDTTYGSDASDLGDLSLLELEVALALLLMKRVLVLLVNQTEGQICDGRIAGLIAGLKAVPSTEVVPTPISMVVTSAVTWLLHERERQQRSPRWWRRILSCLDPRTADTEKVLAGAAGALFPTVAAISEAPTDVDRIDELMNIADRTSDSARRLLWLWAALRHLAATPWRDSTDAETLRRWQRLLGAWDRSSAWFGGNEGAELGRLAAQREMSALTQRIRGGEVTPGSDPSGASASLLYSLAKRQRSLFARRRLLRRALFSLDQQILAAGSAGEDLRHTRSAVNAQLFRVRHALRDAEAALKYRMSQHDTEARIGEAEATLAWASAINLRLSSAKRVAEHGVAILTASQPESPFTVRAMRTRGAIETMTACFRDALVSFDQASRLAMKLQAFDQVRQIEVWRSWATFFARCMFIDRSTTTP